MRYRNSVLGQAEYSFSRRSAFTFSGSYGLLHFPNAGYVSSHMLNAQAGYDYLLDPRNSIAILASYGKIDYTGTTELHDGLYGCARVWKENHGTLGIPGGSRAAADSFGERTRKFSTLVFVGEQRPDL